jgi:hypothetical protein
MSKAALEALITRASSDASYRRQLQFDPRAALAGVDLTAEEFEALKSGNAHRLQALELDEATSRAGARLRLSPTLRWPL